MKKQAVKITLKTDKVVALSKSQVQSLAGGRYPTFSKKNSCWCL